MNFIKKHISQFFNFICQVFLETFLFLFDNKFFKFITGYYLSKKQRGTIKTIFYILLFIVQMYFMYLYFYDTGIPKILSIEKTVQLTKMDGFIHGYLSVISLIISFFKEGITPISLHQNADYYYGVGFGIWFLVYCTSIGKTRKTTKTS